MGVNPPSISQVVSTQRCRWDSVAVTTMALRMGKPSRAHTQHVRGAVADDGLSIAAQVAARS